MKQRSLILSCTALGIIGGVTAAISLFGFDAQAQDMSLKKKGPTPALLPAPAPGESVRISPETEKTEPLP